MASMEGQRKELSSLTNQVKLTLMRAWRERWPDIKWGVQLKRILASCSGETCDLADILLQQALVGSSPNQLVLSYLKHAVLSQVIPTSTVLKHISSFEDTSRPYCTVALIDLAQIFATKLSFTNGPDTGIQLSKSLLALIQWLLLTILKSLQRLQEGKQNQELFAIIENASQAVINILDKSTVIALLQISRSEIADVYREFEQTELNVRGTLSQLQQNVIQNTTREKVSATLASLSKLQETPPSQDPVLRVPHLPICPTLNALVALEAVLNSTNEVQPFVDQVLVIARLMKLSWPQLHQEIFRACFMGLVDSQVNHEELKWAAFTFLKLPQILLKLQLQSAGRDFSSELEQGFELILNYIHLLDLTDIKQKYDCVGQLLQECQRFNLLSEQQRQRLLDRRNTEREHRVPEQSSGSGTVSLIMRAEMTVTSILKTLDADYQKNQDPLVGILNHMLSGRSFEIILAAGASMGELQNFAVKLIKINEFARQSMGEAGKAALTRAQLFDITFLMLCHIIQLYGTEIVSSLKDPSESFIIQWAQRWLPEDGKYKNVEICVPSDPGKVDNLLQLFTSGGELRTNVTRWNDVCNNTPFAIQEVLFAWEHGALNADGVKLILDNVKSRMCCLPVVVCVWLCSYMNTVGEEAREKPLQMLEHLTKPVKGDASNESRNHLMSIVLEKIINDILPINHPQRQTTQIYIPPKALPSEVLQKTLTEIFTKGWIDVRCLHTLEQLLNLCGSDWLCERMVLQMLENSRSEDLCQALSLVVAVFHMDLEHMTLSLLRHTIPRILHTKTRLHFMIDPRGYTLAKLCVLCITAAQEARTGLEEPFVRRGRKRSRKEVEMEEQDIDVRPSKIRKMHEPQLTLHSEGFNLDDISVKEDGEASPTFDTKEPLNKALISLFQLKNAIIHDSSFTPRTGFIVSFIEEAIKCGSQYSQYLLKFMPPKMLMQMMKTIPGVYTNTQVLQICDMSTSAGRKMAAKVICHNSKFLKE